MSQVYYQDPAQWYAREGQRRDDQMRQLMNMIMAAKQFNYEKGQDEWRRDYQERQLAENARYHDMYADRFGQPDVASVPASIQEAQSLVDSGIAGSLGEAVWMLKNRTGGLSTEEFEKRERIKAGIQKEKSSPTTDELDKEYRGKLAAINTNFANKSWDIKKLIAAEEAKIISDPLVQDKAAAIQQLRTKSGELSALADADRGREIETLNTQYMDLPRVQQHILNRKSATAQVMADVNAPAQSTEPPTPPGLPSGAKFVKTDEDGNPVYRFPDGKLYIWKE